MENPAVRPPLTGDEVLDSAAGLEPDVKAGFQASELLKAPTFKVNFETPFGADFSGPVEVRLPSFGDLLAIERITLANGGGATAEWFATLKVCLERAPKAWYRAPKGGSVVPELALDTFPDGDGLHALFREFLAWRRSFRIKGD